MKTRDDRDRPTHLRALQGDRLSRAVPSDRQLAISRALRRTVWADRWHVALTVIGIAMAAAFVLIFVLCVLWPDVVDIRSASNLFDKLVPPMILAWFLAAALADRRYLREFFVPVMLEHTCCPSCGHSLTDLTPEDDGCIVCPECGAAWRMTAS